MFSFIHSRSFPVCLPSPFYPLVLVTPLMHLCYITLPIVYTIIIFAQQSACSSYQTGLGMCCSVCVYVCVCFRAHCCLKHAVWLTLAATLVLGVVTFLGA